MTSVDRETALSHTQASVHNGTCDVSWLDRYGEATVLTSRVETGSAGLPQAGHYVLRPPSIP